jgi:hypothetical protein
MKTHRLQVRSRVIGGNGVTLGAAVLALAAAACTRTMSLGAAGMPDGSGGQTSSDGGNVQADVLPDLQPDRASDVAPDTAPDVVADSGPDVREDARVEHVDGGQSCVDDGITYHSGDVVLRSGCQLSCICTDSVVGDCSGIPCPGDATVIIDPAPVATIIRGGTMPPGVEVSVDTRGAAQRSVASPSPLATPPLPRTFPPGAPEVTLFLYHLQRVGDITRLTVACPDAIVNAIFVRLTSGTGVTSSNLDCPLFNPTPDAVAFVHDVRVLLGIDDGDDSINAQSCTTTGGQLANNLCCSGADNFPDSCGVGACSCSPANLQVVDTCVCPSGACFLKSVGCVGPANVCTVGADQTCNDNPAVNAFHGTCVTGGHCLCHTGFTVVASSGKCS